MDQDNSGQLTKALVTENPTPLPTDLSPVLRQPNGTAVKATPLFRVTNPPQYELTVTTKRYLILEEISTKAEHLVCLTCCHITPQREQQKLTCQPCQKVYPRPEDAKWLSERFGEEVSVDDLEVSP